ncbi:MAG: class I SAM-dependent methyltransferase [Planctomycetota bacterium]
MRSHMYEDLARKEKGYWWHVVRRGNLIDALRRAGFQGGRVLEVGCGTGANLRDLRKLGWSVTGVDLAPEALAHCRDLPVLRANGLKPLPFKDGAFDAVVMLDVLEHLEDVAPLIAETRRVLRTKGVVMVMVPADPSLWSYWDEMNGHRRRYTRESLSACFQGWRREGGGFSFSFMAAPVKIYRRLKSRSVRKDDHTDFIDLPSWLNTLLVAAGTLERSLARILPLPCGTTLSGVWRKTA